MIEAVDGRALSSGVSGLMIRIARYVNDLLSRRGPLWADRFHFRALTTPREARNGMVYVLANVRKHTARKLPSGIDPYSSGASFDGWKGWCSNAGVPPPFFAGSEWYADAAELLGAEFVARTWLCRFGWRRYGLIALDETPAP